MSTVTIVKDQPLTDSERAILRVLLEAVAKVQASTGRAEILAALERQDVEAAIKAVRIDLGEAWLKANLPKHLYDAMQESAQQTQRQMARTGIRINWAIPSPEAVEWIARYVGNDIREWGAASKEALRIILRTGFEGGASPWQVQQMIRTSGIGLNARQAAALARFRARVLMEKPGLKGQKLVDRYAQKLMQYRAMMIARTESAAAASMGRLGQWKASVDAGLLDPNKMCAWSSALEQGRTCDVCEAMDGEKYPLSVVMSGANVFGGRFNHPPDPHPNCLCALILV